MQQKRTLSIAIALWLLLSLFYYNIFNLIAYYPMKSTSHPPYFKKYAYNWTELPRYNGTEDYLINTPGCYIPNYGKAISYKEAADQKRSCYKRIVFVNKTSAQHIQFSIERKNVKKKGHRFQCCYKFATRSSVPGKEDTNLEYTKCKRFENGTEVKQEEELITVSCVLYSVTNATLFTYEDVYLILLKKFTVPLNLQVKNDVVDMTDKWNILMVGVDTMSRGRAYNSLPKTVGYFRKHQWLDYRGYQKVALNTFPNLMSVLTGANSSTAYAACGNGMSDCRHMLIWNKFKEAGYVTAYAEDNLNLPDTFSPYKGFLEPPTDHYARPLFINNEYRAGNVICTKSEPSATRILDYAKQFAYTYKNESYFGLFWMNTIGHNADYLPRLYENTFIEFFQYLNDTDVLSNTFVIFFSDHGVRYGKMRQSKQSHYEDRLPMLFMWVPQGFREEYPIEYYNLQMNQHRLVTPYDLHATMWKILKISKSYVDIVPPQACPEVLGLTEELSAQRTCSDACVEEKFCSCHDLTAVASKNDIAAQKSVEAAVANVQYKAFHAKVTECFKCSPLKLKTVIRNDWYTRGNKTYYVIAFVMSPRDLGFEATVVHYENEFKVLPPTDTIVPYNSRGYCAKAAMRAFCVCIPDEKCKKKKG